MKKITAFAKRNFLEIIRDPLSYIFCVGFPLVMLIVMTIINDSIPAEAHMTVFRIDNLSCGIAVFALMFTMLFTCLTVSKDRSGSFLVRLYTTPMNSGDFIFGYVIPTLALGIIQIVFTFAASWVISLITGVKLDIAGMLLAIITLIPTAVMLLSLGMLFGTLFSEKSAPGVCSIIISLGSFLGSVFFDAESTGGVMLKICEILPFFHAVKAARLAVGLNFEEYGLHLMITVAYAVIITLAATLAFRQKMRADLN